MIMSGAVLTPISPSFVSTDLLTPHQKDRITIPSIGYHSVQRPPIGCKTWGTNLTNYGGIGKLPFLGKTRARDLYVTRSLKHFGSGFSQYKADVQPYQLTSLMKSACRVNDQTVPPAVHTEVDPKKYKLDMYDDVKNRNPYFSHQYLCEVFPYHDPNRAYLPGNVLMTDRTRQDLLKKYTDVYSTHRYSDCYPDHSDVMRERAKRFTSSHCDVTSKPANQRSLEKDTQNSPHLWHGQVYGSDNQHNVTDGFQQTCTGPGDCVCDEEPQLNADVQVDVSPLCYILSQLGPDLNVFSGKDALTHVLQYYGCSAVDVIVNRIRESIADDNSLLLLIRTLGEFSGFVLDKILPLVMGVDMQGASVHDVIIGKIKEPEMKAKEEKKQPVDAHKQYPTLRSFIISTNNTSFNHTLAHMKKKEKQPNIIKGIAPVWPPSGCYVLNKQRMKLETFDSFPKNCCAHPLPAIPTQGERSPSPPYEGKEKKVRFSDTILSFEDDSENRDEEEGEAGPGTSPSGLRWYKKYMDSILPHPTTSPTPLLTQPRVPAAAAAVKGSEPSPHASPQVAVPPILCRYPSAPPSVTRGDWRTRSIVDPNQHLKTLAQRRYHLLHPDPVPDLRQNHTFSKKYFFSGYHTSTFRG